MLARTGLDAGQATDLWRRVPDDPFLLPTPQKRRSPGEPREVDGGSRSPSRRRRAPNPQRGQKSDKGTCYPATNGGRHSEGPSRRVRKVGNLATVHGRSFVHTWRSTESAVVIPVSRTRTCVSCVWNAVDTMQAERPEARAAGRTRRCRIGSSIQRCAHATGRRHGWHRSGGGRTSGSPTRRFVVWC